MRNDRSTFEVLNEALDSAFGTPIEVGGDWSLCAFLRATAINNNPGDPGRVAKESRVSFVSCESDGAVECFFTDDNESVVTLIRVADSELFEKYTVASANWKEFNQPSQPLNAYLSQFSQKRGDKQDGTRLFVNQETHKIVALVYGSYLSGEWVQALISLLPRVMTWAFSGAKEEIKKLCFSLSYVPNKNQDAAEAALIEYCKTAAAKADIRGIVISSALTGIADKMRKTRMSALESARTSYEESISNFEKKLADVYRNYEETMMELTALLKASVQEDPSFREFFINHKDIDILSTQSDGTIEYDVTAPLQYYDEAEFRAMVENKDSVLYTSLPSRIVPILNAVFGEKLGVFQVTARFKLAALKFVSPIRRVMKTGDCAPNPHIYFHACSGGNDKYYAQYAKTGEWDLAIEQSCAATRNLNVGDLTVFQEFANWVDANRKIRCVWANPDLSKVDRITDKTELITIEEFAKRIAKKERKAK